MFVGEILDDFAAGTDRRFALLVMSDNILTEDIEVVGKVTYHEDNEFYLID